MVRLFFGGNREFLEPARDSGKDGREVVQGKSKQNLKLPIYDWLRMCALSYL